MEHTTITIGRQFGSRGRQIAKELAKRLGFSYYDKELLLKASKESGLSAAFLETMDERQASPFFYSLLSGPTSFLWQDQTISTEFLAYQAQRDTILHLAENEDCVIVGRCADYALADNPDCFSVFIHSRMDFRVKRVREYNPEKVFKDDNKVMDFINKIDRKRANYYNYYSNKKWADARSYDLCVDSSILGIDKTVDFITEYAKMRYGHLNL